MDNESALKPEPPDHQRAQLDDIRAVLNRSWPTGMEYDDFVLDQTIDIRAIVDRELDQSKRRRVAIAAELETALRLHEVIAQLVRLRDRYGDTPVHIWEDHEKSGSFLSAITGVECDQYDEDGPVHVQIQARYIDDEDVNDGFMSLAAYRVLAAGYKARADAAEAKLREMKARELADLRDELATSRRETESARESYGLAANDRDELSLRLDQLSAELHRATATTEPEPEKVPCPEGYHWIGQPLRYCNNCSFPPWEHAGVAELDEDAGPFGGGWVLRPFSSGEADRLRRKWDPGMSEWAKRMVEAANAALGNDAAVVLDCSTAQALAAALVEMAERPDKWWHQEEIDGLVAELEQR